MSGKDRTGWSMAHKSGATAMERSTISFPQRGSVDHYSHLVQIHKDILFLEFGRPHDNRIHNLGVPLLA